MKFMMAKFVSASQATKEIQVAAVLLSSNAHKTKRSSTENANAKQDS